MYRSLTGINNCDLKMIYVEIKITEKLGNFRQVNRKVFFIAESTLKAKMRAIVQVFILAFAFLNLAVAQKEQPRFQFINVE
jgi:hypothetical protein